MNGAAIDSMQFGSTVGVIQLTRHRLTRLLGLAGLLSGFGICAWRGLRRFQPCSDRAAVANRVNVAGQPQRLA
jgi:hypothetical protein